MANPPPTPLGRHLLLDLYDCPPELLRFPADSERILLAAATAMGATVIEARFHAFSPHGVSGMVIIAESHLSIHTWPEHGYAAVDVFSCGGLDLAAGLRLLTEQFQATRIQEREIRRGLVD